MESCNTPPAAPRPWKPHETTMADAASAADGTDGRSAADNGTVDDDADPTGASPSPPPAPGETDNGRTAEGRQQHETPTPPSARAAGKWPVPAGVRPDDDGGSPGDGSLVVVSNSGQLTPGRCPMCAKPFASTVDSPARALHVNSHFSENRSAAEETGAWSCHVCNKELSHLNVARRSQHINRCMDAVEPASGGGGSAAALSQKCPICSKVLSLDRSRRVAHLKRYNDFDIEFTQLSSPASTTALFAAPPRVVYITSRCSIIRADRRIPCFGGGRLSNLGLQMRHQGRSLYGAAPHAVERTASAR